MGMNDRSADRKSHTHAIGLRREEGIENPIGYRRIDSYPRIFDRHQQPVWFGGFRGYGKHLLAVRDRGHGFNRIHDQVQQHLLQMNPVTEDQPIVGARFGAKHNAMPLKLTLREHQHIPDSIIDVELRWLRRGVPSERPKISKHISRSLGLAHHARERIAHFVDIGLAPVQPAQTSFAVRHDRAEWLVDLLRKQASELAHRRQPGDAGELRPGTSQRLLDASTLGDVHNRTDEYPVPGLIIRGYAFPVSG
jgi:hypothetical protein